MTGHYRGWDVHAYTPPVQQWFQQRLRPRLPSEGPLLTEWMAALNEMRHVYGKWPAAMGALIKMNSRYRAQQKGYMDRDLGPGGNVASILLYSWALVKRKKEPSLTRLFGETLSDIGNTCVQGDSHRLIMFLFGLLGS